MVIADLDLYGGNLGNMIYYTASRRFCSDIGTVIVVKRQIASEVPPVVRSEMWKSKH